MSITTDQDFLPEDYEDALKITLLIVRQHRAIENCRRYPRCVAHWLMTQSQLIESIEKNVLDAGRLTRDHADYQGPGLSDPDEPLSTCGDMWGGICTYTVYTPHGTNWRTISEW